VKFELILVRYGEIGLKAKETRKRFENTLINNIKNALNIEQIPNKIKREWGRVYVYTEYIDRVIPVLKRVFGITSVSPASFTESNMIFISKMSLYISKFFITPERSFALRVTRTGNHDFTSQDVAIKVGKAIEKSTNVKVNLSNPDVELFIEVRDDFSYFFTEKIRGTGGLPLGSQGKVLALIEDSKSILAAWYLLKRGCAVVFAITNKKILDSLNSFTSYWYVKPTIVFIDSKKNLFNELNKLVIDYKCDSIVTGHALIDNQESVISEIANFKKHLKSVLLNPLIGMNKEEIKKKIEGIGLST
jgi:thiamine biosynthesis protein ThiI